MTWKRRKWIFLVVERRKVEAEKLILEILCKSLSCLPATAFLPCLAFALKRQVERCKVAGVTSMKSHFIERRTVLWLLFKWPPVPLPLRKLRLNSQTPPEGGGRGRGGWGKKTRGLFCQGRRGRRRGRKVFSLQRRNFWGARVPFSPFFSSAYCSVRTFGRNKRLGLKRKIEKSSS